jgi:hypothetical protein
VQNVKTQRQKIAEERARYALALACTWSLPFDHPFCAALRRARNTGGPMPGLAEFARTASAEDAEVVAARLNMLAALTEQPEWIGAFSPSSGPTDDDGARAAA